MCLEEVLVRFVVDRGGVFGGRDSGKGEVDV